MDLDIFVQYFKNHPSFKVSQNFYTWQIGLAYPTLERQVFFVFPNGLPRASNGSGTHRKRRTNGEITKRLVENSTTMENRWSVHAIVESFADPSSNFPRQSHRASRTPASASSMPLLLLRRASMDLLERMFTR